MKTAARILVFEDNPADYQLLEETLKSNGLMLDFVHARTKDEFQAALQQKFDLIISDFSIPGYSGFAALDFSKRLQPETPFIFVSGSIGEECAVETLKYGATDYVLKDRLGRVSQAVERALREAKQQSEHLREAARHKQLEEQLHQAQKMEAIGQLAGGIAHDFNNLLLVIHGNAELVLRNETLADEDRECLKNVVSASERATNLVRQLLAFGRKQVVHFQSFDLNQSISNLAKLLKRIIGEDIQLECDCARDLPSIHADAGMIEQALTNLIVNARDAMPRGGALIVSTESIFIDKAALENHPDGQIGNFVCVTVKDTGTGIPPEHLPRIFEPFFTTKEVGKGTGLGLSMVYGIIRQHQGWIEVSTRPGEGTEFKIYLPANVANGEKSIAPIRPEKLPKESGKILLVEDDDDVRNFIRTVLEGEGHQIKEAASGLDALKIWKDDKSRFNLLLTDIVMPNGVNGKQLAERIHMEQPDLKVIFMSGYNPDIAGKIQPEGCFLQKPCSIETLVATVESCLASKNSAPKLTCA
ncbi:MAG TPA: response regulator [Verrucomicrobiae bacterium]|nr:response regulator [Verrucomicrobiae bacterium]